MGGKMSVGLGMVVALVKEPAGMSVEPDRILLPTNNF